MSAVEDETLPTVRVTGTHERVGRAHHPDPVFLLAPARSYSTVCLALLAGHPDIYGFPELLLFSTQTVGGLLTERSRRPDVEEQWLRNRLSGILRAVADLHSGDQSPEAVRDARRWLAERPQWTTIELMDHLLALAAPRIGLEKSPDTVEVEGALEACVRAYPRARFLHLTRHPVTTQRSMHRYWSRGTVADAALPRHAARVWQRGHLTILRVLDGVPPQQRMRVRAEDLLRDPNRWMPRVLGWLGLEWPGDTLERMRHTERWRFAGTGAGGDLFGGDGNFMRAPRLRPITDPGPVRFDPAWDLPEEMREKMRALAAYLGY